MALFELGALSSNTTRTFDHSVGRTNLENTYRFSITDASRTSLRNIHASLTGLSAIGDPYQTADISIYYDLNNNGLIDTIDDVLVGDSINLDQDDEVLDLRTPETGTYILQVLYRTTSSGTNSSTPYTLRISNTGNSRSSNLLPTEINAGSLRRLAPSYSYDGFLADRSALVYTLEDDTVDTIAFTMDTSGNFNASLTNASNANMRLIKDVNNNGVVDQGDERAIATRGSSGDAAINVLSLESGSYFLQTYLDSDDTDTHYTLRMSNTGWHPSELLQTEFDAGTLSSTPFVHTGWVSGMNDSTDHATDVFRFKMDIGDSFNASLTGLTSDVYLRLIQDANNNGIVDPGEDIVRSVLESNRDQFINLRFLAPGTYFLQPYLIRGGSATSYTLMMSNTGDEPSNLLPLENDVGVLSTNPIEHSDSVGTEDSADLFRFTMATAGSFQAVLTGITPGSGNNVDLRLIQDMNNNGVVDAGDELYRSEAWNQDDIITAALQAGTYFLQTYDDSLYLPPTVDYTLRMSQTA